jgi:hypothetical protein
MSPSASKIAIVILSGLFATALHSTAALADGLPQLDVSETCNAAARGAISAGRDKASCLADERAAQEALAKDWSTYNAVHKNQCLGSVKTGGPASYVELLSCLEVMRDAKKFREEVESGEQPMVSGPAQRRR